MNQKLINKLNISEHERVFELVPIGIKYICEFCNKGEQRMSPDNSFNPSDGKPLMLKHVCSECGKEMMLPKPYPFVEWIPKEELNED